VEIVSYHASWPAEFQQFAARLHAALGDLALQIDHIGSTAIPGLAAKDIIDIQVTVAALDDSVLAALTAAGYTHVSTITRDHRPADCDAPDVEWEKWFFRPPPGQRPTNLHVRVAGRANQRYALLFRDYLRAHPAMAQAYGELKRRLMANLADRTTYPDVKDPAVDLIYLAAKAWATSYPEA
jgi:GrpB-like predicted nucleotidyltransferase (UPF0157 family)